MNQEWENRRALVNVYLPNYLTYRLQNFNFVLMNLQESFGNRVHELRKKKKWSQEELAFRAGIDRTYMTSVENGKRNVSIQNIEKIITALEVSLVTFFDSNFFVEVK